MTTCIICLDTQTFEDYTTLSKCKHSFHSKCLYAWKFKVIENKQKYCCPICKKSISLIKRCPSKYNLLYVNSHKYNDIYSFNYEKNNLLYKIKYLIIIILISILICQIVHIHYN